MFLPLTFDVNTIDEFPDYCAPITSQEGAIIVNTEVLAENNLPMPTCIKDLADPVYKDMVSVTDIQSSSTAWLLIQAPVSYTHLDVYKRQDINFTTPIHTPEEISRGSNCF